MAIWRDEDVGAVKPTPGDRLIERGERIAEAVSARKCLGPLSVGVTDRDRLDAGKLGKRLRVRVGDVARTDKADAVRCLGCTCWRVFKWAGLHEGGSICAAPRDLMSTTLSPAGPRILFVAPRYPYPPWRGDQVRAFQLVKALAPMAQVKLLSFGEGEPLPLEGVELRSVKSRPSARALANLRARPTLPAQVRVFLDAAMTRAIGEEIEGWKPNVLHVTLARMAPYMPQSAPFHRHLDFVDSLGLNMRTRAGAHRGPARAAFSLEARLMAAYEAKVASLADTCSVVSEADREMPGLGRAAVIPNGVDPEAFPFTPPQGRERRRWSSSATSATFTTSSRRGSSP